MQVLLQETGEHVLLTAGEVHLERCLKDLEEFAQVPITASDPIVPYRETIIVPPKVDRTNEIIVNSKKVDTFAQVSEPMFSLKFSAKPLPASIVSLLIESSTVLKTLDRLLRQELELTDLIPEAKSELEIFVDSLHNTLDKEGPFWSKLKDKIWTFGPNRVGANILINQCTNYDRPSIFDLAFGKASFDWLRECDSSISHGFQLATASGPLTEEPMLGVAIFVHEWSLHSHEQHLQVTKETGDEDSVNHESNSGAGSSVSCFTALSGKLISSSRETIRKAIQVRLIGAVLEERK